MSEMVERIARVLNPVAWAALDDASREAGERGFCPELATNHLKGGVDLSLKAARAVLMEVREPTDAMREMGADIMDAEDLFCLGLRASIAYQAMIDVALK